MISLVEITLQVDGTYIVHIEDEDGTCCTCKNITDMATARERMNQLIDTYTRANEPWTESA